MKRLINMLVTTTAIVVGATATYSIREYDVRENPERNPHTGSSLAVGALLGYLFKKQTEYELERQRNRRTPQ
jgi:hypothetical protein